MTIDAAAGGRCVGSIASGGSAPRQRVAAEVRELIAARWCEVAETPLGALRGPVAITVTQLTSFLAVVRGGSVTAAAEQLVVTQPSVSRRRGGALARARGRADRARGPRSSPRPRARPSRRTPPTCSRCSTRAGAPLARPPTRRSASCASRPSPPPASTSSCRSSRPTRAASRRLGHAQRRQPRARLRQRPRAARRRRHRRAPARRQRARRRPLPRQRDRRHHCTRRPARRRAGRPDRGAGRPSLAAARARARALARWSRSTSPSTGSRRSP